MKRIGMMLAAVVAGGVLLTTGEAVACEGHRSKTDAPSAAVPAKTDPAASTEAAPAKLDAAEEQHAAKCQCGSAAD
ncbi:MAG TPA: metallothionein, partial [Archangium sp.]